MQTRHYSLWRLCMSRALDGKKSPAESDGTLCVVTDRTLPPPPPPRAITILSVLARRVRRGGFPRTASATASLLSILWATPVTEAFSPGGLREAAPCAGFAAARFRPGPTRFFGPGGPGAPAGPHRLRGGAQGSPRGSTQAMAEAAGMRLIDTCVNLHDEMFQGVYNEKQRHEPDWDLIVERAVAAGVERMIGVSGSLQDSEKSAL